MITYKSFIIFVTFLVLWIIQIVTYNQVYCYIGYLIESSIRIHSINSLFTRLSSDYTLDLLLLGFVTNLTIYW